MPELTSGGIFLDPSTYVDVCAFSLRNKIVLKEKDNFFSPYNLICQFSLSWVFAAVRKSLDAHHSGVQCDHRY